MYGTKYEEEEPDLLEDLIAENHLQALGGDQLLVMWGWCYYWFWRLALIALCKQPKCVNLSHKVGHAGPSTEPKPDYQNPHNYE